LKGGKGMSREAERLAVISTFLRMTDRFSPGYAFATMIACIGIGEGDTPTLAAAYEGPAALWSAALGVLIRQGIDKGVCGSLEEAFKLIKEACDDMEATESKTDLPQ
jgi:hypothetical protein